MKVVVAIDSLKGSLSTLEAGEAAKVGILKAVPDAEIWVRPLADGGEGTVEALTLGMGGKRIFVKVIGPLGEEISCTYGIIEESKTAIIEMSAAAGITLVPEEKRNPMHTTTYGVGQVIKDAIVRGCRHFIVGIGGSATNDGGIGMLQALGYGMLDKNGNQVPFGAKGLPLLTSITDDQVIPQLKECTFRIACDVKNPLCGETGCSVVFAPQKGADMEMIAQMDQWLENYAKLTVERIKEVSLKEEQDLRGDADAQAPGAGAAGGLGFAFLSYTNAVLESGIQIVLEETKLEEYIKNADLVVTGEGRLDSQSIYGKAPIGVAQMAKKYHKKVIAFAGSVSEDASVCNDWGIDAFFSILRRVQTLPEALEPENAKKNMAATAEQVFRLFA